MSEDTVRWGVIGAGGFADRRFLPYFAEAPSAELHAVMVRDQARAEEIARAGSPNTGPTVVFHVP